MATETPSVAAFEEQTQAVAAVGGAQATDAVAPEAVEPQSNDPLAPAATEEKVICRRCNEETDQKDALCQEKFRVELRWTCKACHALLTQLNRHGVDSRVRTDTEAGEFQPLSYWELKGYNIENIEKNAEKRTHPLLGATYKVDIESTSVKHIHAVTEERILKMEAEARERASARSQPAAPLSAPLDLPLAPEEVQHGKKRKTPEEKKLLQEQAKAQRQEDKKRQRQETAACAAAAKLLPQLKKCHEKMADCNEKIAALSSVVALPDASKEELESAQNDLDSALANCTKILGTTAKGGSLNSLPAGELATDKDLNAVVKSGNAAIRTAQQFIRANRENLPKKAAKAKAKK
eukprot:s1575_g7.t1